MSEDLDKLYLDYQFTDEGLNKVRVLEIKLLRHTFQGSINIDSVSIPLQELSVELKKAMNL